jgi:hypothetical protein
MKVVVSITKTQLDAVRQTEAKFAFEQQIDALSSQRNELAHLQGRAKDILGLLTLAGTFIGAFAKAGDSSSTNTGLLFQELSTSPGWIVFMFAALPLLTFASCLLVLWPRTWIFNISGKSIVDHMQDRQSNEGFASDERLYMKYIEKLHTDFAGPNAERLRSRGWALWIAMTALIAEVGLIVYLVAF